MKKETEEVYNSVKNPSREQIRIVQFGADGAGTYTPAGHWNAIAADDFIKKDYSEVRWAHNMALLNMSLMDAAIVCWNTKYYYFNPRPSQVNPAIKNTCGCSEFSFLHFQDTPLLAAPLQKFCHILFLKRQLPTRQWHRKHLCRECTAAYIAEAIARQA